MINLYKYISSLSRDYLENLYYDRDKNVSILDKYLLISKVSCHKQHKINNRIDNFVTVLSKFCKKPLVLKEQVTVIKDETLSYYIANPSCIGIPLYRIIRDKIAFDLKIKFDIRVIEKEKSILTSYVKNNINKVDPKLVVNVKSIPDSKNNIKISFSSKEIKNDNFDPIISIKSFIQDLEDNNLEISIKEDNIIHIKDCNI